MLPVRHLDVADAFGTRHSWPVPFDTVAIASSTGGLEAVGALLTALPRDFPAAVLLVQHRQPAHAQLLAELLRPRTHLRVVDARGGEPLAGGTLAIAPPGRQLLVTAAGTIRLAEPDRSLWPLPRGTADPLFMSIAAIYRERAIGVVLSGRSRDGANGVRAIKARGGRVLVQDPFTASSSQMPAAAVATGCADLVLPPAMLGRALTALTMVPGAAVLLGGVSPQSSGSAA